MTTGHRAVPAGSAAPRGAPPPPDGPAAEGGPASWRLRDRSLPLDRPVVMGILNITPDSFSDGGVHLDPHDAAAAAWRMADDGADLLDLGAESTRPGAAPVSADEEWSRLEPVLARLEALDLPVSVDTTKSAVAARALERGVAAINDVSGLRTDPALADLAARTGAGLVLMHMRGTPRTMQEDVRYDDLIGDVRRFLRSALRSAVERGCAEEQVVLDPGIGFGKSARGNLALLARVGELRSLGRPILVGPSRKSFLGEVLDVPVDERLEGTIASCVVALERGARVFRVHDVGPVRRALDVAEAIRREDPVAGAEEAPGGPNG